MVSIEEKIAVVQCYIHHKKNIEVKINYPQNIRQLALLDKAYLIAVKHLKNA